MMTRRNEREFCVVQFLELPFEGIDDYVCVPRGWVIIRKATEDKSVVAYPKDENPFITRDRVKRKEKIGNEWRFYMATIKYESDSYSEAEYWLATRNDYGPVVVEESQPTYNMQLRRTQLLNMESFTTNGSRSSISNDSHQYPLLTIKREALPEPQQQLNRKRLKREEPAQSSSAVANTGCSTSQQLVDIQDDQSTVSHLHNSLEGSARSYSQLNRAQRLVPNHKTVENKIRPMNIPRNLTNAPRDPSNVIDLTGSSLASSGCQENRRVPRINTTNSRGQTVPKINLKRSHDVAAVDQRNVLQGIPNIATASQNLPSSSQRSNFRQLNRQQSSLSQEQCLTSSYQTSEFPQQRQLRPNQQASQNKVQKRKVNFKRASSILEKVLKSLYNTLSSIYSSDRSNVEQLQADESESVLVNESHSNEQNNCENVERRLREDELLSYHPGTSDSKIQYHEINAPVETTDNNYCTDAFGRRSADRPTANQNSTSTNQTHSRAALEQHVSGNINDVLIQMGSVLQRQCDMYNNLRSSLLETAKMYRNLLRAIKKLKTAENSASNGFSLNKH